MCEKVVDTYQLSSKQVSIDLIMQVLISLLLGVKDINNERHVKKRYQKRVSIA